MTVKLSVMHSFPAEARTRDHRLPARERGRLRRDAAIRFVAHSMHVTYLATGESGPTHPQLIRSSIVCSPNGRQRPLGRFHSRCCDTAACSTGDDFSDLQHVDHSKPWRRSACCGSDQMVAGSTGALSSRPSPSLPTRGRAVVRRPGGRRILDYCPALFWAHAVLGAEYAGADRSAPVHREASTIRKRCACLGLASGSPVRRQLSEMWKSLSAR